MGQQWALCESQLWAEMGMSLKQYYKCQITNNVPMTKYESQQWEEIGTSLK
jgi:hypothetical protein